MSLEDRAKLFASRAPQLRVELSLYPEEISTRSNAILPGWSCPCFAVKEAFENRRAQIPASDGAPILVDGPMQLGETREVDFIFPLAGKDAGPLIEKVTKFYLWEGGYIGEVDVLEVYD
jgi:hypothetical protein